MGDEFFQTWNAGSVEPSKVLDPIPQADYLAILTKGEWKRTSTGNGEFLALEFTITEGEYAKRKQWDNLNLKNPSTQAVEIAKGAFSALCRAVGVMTPRNLTDLYNRPLLIAVRMAKDDRNGQMKNVIKGYKPKPGGGTAAPAPVAAAAPVAAPVAAAAAGTESAPWDK
jgi:hypothetical protein